jgi:hypothetical protein
LIQYKIKSHHSLRVTERASEARYEGQCPSRSYNAVN